MSLASGCPWRQDSRGELSRVRSVASGCRGPSITVVQIEAAVAKIYITNTKKLSLKKFLETLNLFSQPEFSEKGVYQNWIGQVM